MSGVAKKLMGTTAAGADFLAIEDCFSCFLYTGNSSTQTITNGIDLAGEGGLVWIKTRNGTVNHYLYDTERSVTKELSSNTNGAEANASDALTSFNPDGFSLGADNGTNRTSNTHASWTFRKAPRFFDVVTYTGDGTSNRQIAHNIGGTVGFIILKRYDSTGNWLAWHKDVNPGFGLLDITAEFTTGSNGFFENVTDTYFETSWQNTSGATYVAYLFAHDPLGPSGDGSDGLIDCGSYTSDATGKATIDIGWEPQWVLYKGSSAATHWSIADSMRGFVADTASTRGKYLNANQSAAELSNAPVGITSTGFKYDSAPNTNFIYIAIRRGPMRAPESGTEVFNVADDRLSPIPGFVSGFPVDFAFRKYLSGGGRSQASSRLTQGRYLDTSDTAAEYEDSSHAFDYMNGWYSGGNSGWYSWMFRRAPEFFDVVAYTGNGTVGRTVPHNLGVAPEMMIVKARNSVRDWPVYHVGVDATAPEDYKLVLNKTDIPADEANIWNDTAPTDTVFTVGSDGETNGSGQTYIAYLFATLAGVSKVGSYTGNGTSQTINCGFTTGARFILIKRTDSTGDWYVWDTARGIVTGNDPFLELNTTDAEVTSDDSIDPDSSGFIVNQTATTNVNVSSASYIFYAVS